MIVLIKINIMKSKEKIYEKFVNNVISVIEIIFFIDKKVIL